MNFELLPNEILLDIFDYLTGLELLHRFYSLNARLNFLLYNHFRSYRFYFSRLSKRQFDMICQQNLPFIADRVTVLTLSDSNESPGQIDLFFSYIPSITSFIHLTFLKLSDLRSYPILIKIVDELHDLPNLTSLDLYFRSNGHDKVDVQLIVDNIWSLPKLVHCHFEIDVDLEQIFCFPTKVSTALRDLTMSGFVLKCNDLYRLLEYTPYLKCLDTYITYTDDADHRPYLIPTLIYLNIGIYDICYSSKMILLLQNIPNLRYLNVRLSFNLINGYQWEQIIRNYLPNLKIFELSMTGKLSGNQNMEEQVNELINSFQSIFWTDEHKWFVRCFTYDRKIQLQTLSEIYYPVDRNLPDLWKSTYPDDDQYKLYNTIETLYHDEIFERQVPSCLHLHNVQRLVTKLPIHDEFWTIVPNLNKLTSLRVSFDTNTDQTQLQYLLDHAPCLRRLYIRQRKLLPLQMSLFQYRNESIRELHLQEYNYHFNEEESVILSQSPLGIQCKILSIKVKNRRSILILIQHMIKLRALHVQSEDPEHLSLTDNVNGSDHADISNKDNLIQWSRDNLPSTCFISTDSYFVNRIRIWIQ